MHPTAARVTVFLVDDDHSTLDALGCLLRSAGYATKAYTSLKDFLDEDDPSVHGCAVLDLLGLNALDVQQELANTGIDRPIIFLGGNGSVPASMEALKAGAVDFLIKPVQAAELLRAIKIAVKRDSNRLHLEAIVKRVNELTPRERLVVTLVIRGMLDKQVATALRIREIAVKASRCRAMKKLGVKNVAELVRMTRKIPS